MKAICLAGGSGTRLYPLTLATSKQLVPVYDKPLIYYSLSLAMLARIREILLISSPECIGSFQKLLGDGSRFGIELSYAVQPKPEGIAQAFIIGEEFLGNDSACLILGDNVLFGQNLSTILSSSRESIENKNYKSILFGCTVSNPSAYGVGIFNDLGFVTSIIEKPKISVGNTAIIGLYMYDNSVIEKVKTLKLSHRGEYEITDLNNLFISEGTAKLDLLSRGIAWFDCGTPKSLLECSDFIAAVQTRQNLMISCLEEIGFRMGFLSQETLKKIVEQLPKSSYKDYFSSSGLVK